MLAGATARTPGARAWLNTPVTSSGDRTPVRRVPEWLVFLAFAGPNLLLLAVFAYWPLLLNAYLSLVDWDMIAPDTLWVGLDNWKLVLSDPSFWFICRTTLFFAVGSVGA